MIKRIVTLAAWLHALKNIFQIRQALYLLLPLVFLSTSGCSSMKNWVVPQGSKLHWESLSMHVVAGANRDFPLAIDVVMVSDEALAQRLSTMSSREWFAARESLRKTNPETLDFDSLEIAPGESLMQSGKRWSGRRVFAALVFADYFAEGLHLARLESLKGRLHLEFGVTDFSVTASEK